jgi:hypothetical protein
LLPWAANQQQVEGSNVRDHQRGHIDKSGLRRLRPTAPLVPDVLPGQCLQRSKHPQALKLGEALLRGELNRMKIALTNAHDKVREFD